MAKAKVNVTELADRYRALQEAETQLKKEKDTLRDEILGLIRAGVTVTASSGHTANASSSTYYDFDVTEALPVIRRRRLPLGELLKVNATAFRNMLPDVWGNVSHTTSSVTKLTWSKSK